MQPARPRPRPRDTTDTGYPLADAFMWTHPPGNTAAAAAALPVACSGPTSPIGLGDRANEQLGPGFPSLPY